MQNNGVQCARFRGAQIERPITSKEKVFTLGLDEEEEDVKKYESFIINDWKNNRPLTDYSINPDNFSSFSIESKLPYENSLIFFDAKVLDKYKNDPDKYKLNERSIACKGGWYLKTYDINKYQQIHTYPVYLAHLPFKEQQHWKQFNEKPKGPMSERAFKTDFQGSWDYEQSKMQELKTALEALSNIIVGGNLQIWKPNGGSWDIAFRGLHLLITENSNQWHDFNIYLANATNEGFQSGALRKIAKDFGNPDQKLQTLGLIKHILESTGNSNLIADTHKILNDIQGKRSGGKAHGDWNIPEGSLIEDAQNRLEKVTKAIKILTAFFKDLEMAGNSKPTKDKTHE